MFNALSVGNAAQMSEDLLRWATSEHKGLSVLIIAPLWAGLDRQYVKFGFEMLAEQLQKKQPQKDVRVLLIITLENDDHEARKFRKELRKFANAKLMSTNELCPDLCNKICNGSRTPPRKYPTKYPAVLVMHGNPCTDVKECVEGLRPQDIEAVLRAVAERETVGGVVEGLGVRGHANPVQNMAHLSSASDSTTGRGWDQSKVEAYCSETIYELLCSTRQMVHQLKGDVRGLQDELTGGGRTPLVPWQCVCTPQHVDRVKVLCEEVQDFNKKDHQDSSKNSNIRCNLDFNIFKARCKLQDCSSAALEEPIPPYIYDSIQQLGLRGGGEGGLALPEWVAGELDQLDRLSTNEVLRREAPLAARVRLQQEAEAAKKAEEKTGLGANRAGEEEDAKHLDMSPLAHALLSTSPWQHLSQSPDFCLTTPSSQRVPGAREWAGSSRKEWRQSPGEFAYGVLCVSPAPDTLNLHARDKIWRTPLSKLLMSPEGVGSNSMSASPV